MRRVAMLVGLALAASCGSDAPSAPLAPNFVGTWTLETVDSKALPVVLEQYGEDKLELMDAGLTAAERGSFTSVTTQRTTIAGEAQSESYTEGGSYSLSGPVVKLTFSSDGMVVVGTIVGDSLIFTNGSMPLIYRRR